MYRLRARRHLGVAACALAIALKKSRKNRKIRVQWSPLDPGLSATRGIPDLADFFLRLILESIHGDIHAIAKAAGFHRNCGARRRCIGHPAGRKHHCAAPAQPPWTYRVLRRPGFSGLPHAGRNRRAEHDASPRPDRSAARRDERRRLRARHSRPPSRRCGPASAPSPTRLRPRTSARRPTSIRACVSPMRSTTTRRSAPSAWRRNSIPTAPCVFGARHWCSVPTSIFRCRRTPSRPPTPPRRRPRRSPARQARASRR